MSRKERIKVNLHEVFILDFIAIVHTFGDLKKRRIIVKGKQLDASTFNTPFSGHVNILIVGKA